MEDMEEKPHVCSSCYEIFDTADILENHKEACLERRPFVCQNCQMTFEEESELVQHNLEQHLMRNENECQAQEKEKYVKIEEDLGEEEEVLDPEVHMPNDVDFIKPPPLEELVDPTQTKHSFIPKQGELNKLLQQINTRILQGTHLVQDLRDLKAAYLASPHFRDIYIYLCQNKVLLNRLAAR